MFLSEESLCPLAKKGQKWYDTKQIFPMKRGLFFMSYLPPRPPRAVRDGRRPKGAARLWEMLTRDLGSFWKASLFCCLAIVPGGLLVATGLLGGTWLLVLAGGILIGVLGAPFYCGMLDTVLRSLRDEPGYWWHTYSRAWRQNWRDCLIPGLLLGLWGGAWGSALMLFADMEQAINNTWVSLMVAGVLSVGLFNNLFCQIPLLSLPLGTLMRNALFLFLGYLPRTLAAAAIQSAYWAVVFFAMPYDVPFFVALGFWVPCLFSAAVLYPCLESAFHIEQTLKERKDEEVEAYMAEREPKSAPPGGED